MGRKDQIIALTLLAASLLLALFSASARQGAGQKANVVKLVKAKSVQIITDNEGNVLGTGINHYQYEMALPNIMLHIDDSLHVSVRHLMRRECLPGITDIGLTLERNGD